jgi:hypothetical protein
MSALHARVQAYFPTKAWITTRKTHRINNTMECPCWYVAHNVSSGSIMWAQDNQCEPDARARLNDCGPGRVLYYEPDAH